MMAIPILRNTLKLSEAFCLMEGMLYFEKVKATYQEHILLEPFGMGLI
jgi:hypothetical protein